MWRYGCSRGILLLGCTADSKAKITDLQYFGVISLIADVPVLHVRLGPIDLSTGVT